MGKEHDLERHRTALRGHCYRMLGSVSEADDAVQETMVRAWRKLEGFDERSSLKTWLYRIATNVCLDLLADRNRRERPMEEGGPGTIEDPLVERPRSHWLEPVPDAWALPSDADPAERAILKQSIKLAFVAAIQHLPPRQRAALLLAEVLGWSAVEVAEGLEMSVAAVNSALQRARATLAAKDLSLPRAPLSDAQTELVARYVDAFERYDMSALTALLHQEASLSMPPYTLWLQGHENIVAWMLGRGSACRGSKLVPVEANGAPAFGHYKPGGPGEPMQPWSLIILELAPDGQRITALNHFLDTKEWFPRFGLPMTLDPADR